MTKRIFRGILQVSALSAIACFALVLTLMFDVFSNAMNGELELSASLAASAVEQGGVDYLHSLDMADLRLTWIAPDGHVIYDNQADPATMGDHSQREEVIQAIATGSGSSERYSSTMAYRIVYRAVRLKDGSVFRVSGQRYSRWWFLANIGLPVVVVLALVALISVFMSSKLSRRIVKPINEIDPEKPDAQCVYPELSPLLNKLDRQSRDITNQLEQMDRRSSEFKLITDNMAEGFVTVDAQGEVLSYNASAMKRLGSGEGSLMLDGTFREAVNDALQGRHNEQTCLDDGKVYSLIADPVYEKDCLSGAVVIILDITEKEQREKLRREFTSNVSHELKTPLTSIYGISELMTTSIVKPEDMAGFAQSIHQETGRLMTLIDDIINLSQLDENIVPQEKYPVDLYNLAAQIVARLEKAAREKSVTLSLEGQPVTVTGIGGILDEMIFNLVDNAIKYNREGGFVKVFVGLDQGKPEVSVADNGIGIPEAHQERVFERFYRVDKSHSRKIGGTGLGLSIVKHGAAYHNATVTLKSAENKGTRFTITFN